MRETYINRDYSYGRQDGKSWFWIIIILMMITTIGIVWSNYRSANQCEYSSCQRPATTIAKDPSSGEIRSFCDEHGAEMILRGWIFKEGINK